MASIRRKFSFKRDHKISDATATNGSFVDGPVNISSNQPPVSFGHKDHHFDVSKQVGTQKVKLSLVGG